MQGPDCPPTLLIIGASVRAAIESASRANLSACGADLFADVDAVRQAEVIRVTDYPQGFLQLVRDLAPASLIYTGGLENHPTLVAEISRSTRVWGNSAPVLRAVRSPQKLTRAWSDWQIPHPQTLLAPPTSAHHTWLQKSYTTTAGSGVATWQPATPLPTDRYLQQFIAGTSCAAIYVAAARHCRLLGVTEQLIQRSWTGAQPFGYAGSMGPLPLAPSLQTQFTRIGDCLAECFELRGLFGVDVIIRDQTVYPIEVNPRYTASVEVWERATGQPAFTWHKQACHGHLPAIPRSQPMTTDVPRTVYGKAILFADRDCHLTAELVDDLSEQRLACGTSAYSDIPHAGERILRSHPVATVWAQATSTGVLENTLHQQVVDLRQRLAENHSAPN